ncbi:PH domain-containing protein [Actinopolymorpha alba]|uniref:PH domain-containing protein n=1 Tax=Actinopolymorpha alba TaxID=533267 RepID=UPI00036F6C06|nr:PH domain-containing protein [Actinopolymorpha alba]
MEVTRTPSDAATRTYRRTGTMIFGIILWAYAIAFSVGWMVKGPVADAFLERLGLAVVVIPALWFAWRVTGHSSVRVGDDGVTIRNPVFTYRIPWPALASARMDDGHLVIAATDRSVKVSAYSPSMMAEWRGRSREEELIDSLRAEIRRRNEYQPLAHSRRRIELGLPWIGAVAAVWVAVSYVASVLVQR